MTENPKLSEETLARIDEAIRRFKIPGSTERKIFEAMSRKTDARIEEILDRIRRAERFTAEDWNTFVGGCDE